MEKMANTKTILFQCKRLTPQVLIQPGFTRLSPQARCYLKRNSPCTERPFFSRGMRCRFSPSHSTCFARRSQKCPPVWVWLAFSFCRLCCCRPWPWRKNRLRSSRKMQPAQLPLKSTKRNSQPAIKMTLTPSKRRLKPACRMNQKTADFTCKNFPTQSVSRFICD